MIPRTGNLPLKAEVKKMVRSQAVPVADIVSLAIRSPVRTLDEDPSPNVRNADDSPIALPTQALEVFAPARKDDVTVPAPSDRSTSRALVSRAPSDRSTSRALVSLAPSDRSTSRALVSLAPNAPCATVSLAAGVSNAMLASMPVDAACTRSALDATAGPRRMQRHVHVSGSNVHFARARLSRDFPDLDRADIASRSTMPARLGADISAIDNVLAGHGAPAEACTAPVFVDFEFAP